MLKTTWKKCTKCSVIQHPQCRTLHLSGLGKKPVFFFLFSIICLLRFKIVRIYCEPISSAFSGTNFKVFFPFTFCTEIYLFIFFLLLFSFSFFFFCIYFLQWGVFKIFRSGRMKCLWIELVELTPMPEWQTQMLLRCWEIYFQSWRRAVPIETVWEDVREKSYLTHSLIHEDTVHEGVNQVQFFPPNFPYCSLYTARREL
jgi:hypothetical protein